MYIIEQTPEALGITIHNLDIKTGSVIKDKKAFNKKELKIFTYPVNLNTQKAVKFITEKHQTHNMCYTHIPKELISELESKFILIPLNQMSARVYQNTGNKYTASYCTEVETIKTALTELLKEVQNDNILSKYNICPKTKALKRFIKLIEIPPYYKFIVTAEGKICMFYETETTCYVYCNNIPDMLAYLPNKLLILGYEYNDLLMTQEIQYLPDYTLEPVYHIYKKATGFLKEQTNNMLKQTSGVYNIDKLQERMCQSNLHKPIRDGIVDSLLDIIIQNYLNPLTQVTLLENETGFYFIDIIDNDLPLCFHITNNGSDVKTLLSPLNIKTIRGITSVNLDDIDFKKEYHFDNGKETLDISGKANSSVRNQLNKIDKLIESGELIVKEFKGKLGNTPEYILQDLLKIVDIWKKDWNNRHKRGSELNKDNVTVGIGYRNFMSIVTHAIKPEIRNNLETYIAIIYQQEKPVAMVADIRVTKNSAFNADAVTLNKETIKGLRQKLNLLAMRYWLDETDVEWVTTGCATIPGLIELKKQLRPSKVWKTKYL